MQKHKQPPDAERAPREKAEAPWRPFVAGLRAFVAQRVPSADAEDVHQETLARLHEAAPSLRDASRAEAWVFAIARRTVADFYRARERRPVEAAVGAAEDVPDEASLAQENLAGYDGAHSVHEEVLSWLRPMADELPEAYRRALVMADFEGHTQQKVADALGLSLSGAKSRVQRARRRLGEALAACCAVEFGPAGRATSFRRKQQGCAAGRCAAERSG